MTSAGFNRKQKGRAAEDAAALYLAAKGYRIIERNWSCRAGEIDIIAERDGRLVFVEVRSRSGSMAQGTPEEAVTLRKIEQVRRTAGVYLHVNSQTERLLSFDAVAVRLKPDLSVSSLHHIRDAF